MRSTPEPEKQLGAAGRWSSAVLLLLILAAGTALRGYHLGAECFDSDELYAVRLGGTSPRAVALVVARDAFHTNHPPLMTLPYLYWNALVGTDEGRVRLLPLLLSLLAIVLTWRLGVRLGGPRAGLFAAALLAFNPLHVAYAREARQYAMLTVLVAAAHLSFVRCLQLGRRLDHAVYPILCLLAALTHYFAVLALTPHAVVCVWLLVRGASAGRRAAVRQLLTMALAGVLALPWLLVVRFQAAQPWPHLAEADAGSLTRCLLDVAGVRTPRDHGLLGLAVVFFLSGVGLWATRQRGLAVAAAPAPPPLPRWVGGLAVAIGLMGAAVAFREVPSRLAPLVRATLETYGYGATVIESEVRVLSQLLIAAPAALAAAGLLLLAWPVLVRVACRPGPASASISVSLLSVSLLVVPLAATWAVGRLGVPFVQTRNLIVLVTPLSVAAGLGLAVLWSSRIGRLATAGTIAVLLVTASQYRPIAAPLGRDGYPLGMYTYNWRGLDAALGTPGTPLLTTKTSATDPLLYYSASRTPRRLDPSTDRPPLPDEFFLAHVEGDAACAAVLERLIGDGATFVPRFRDGDLVLLAVKMRGASVAATASRLNRGL